MDSPSEGPPVPPHSLNGVDELVDLLDRSGLLFSGCGAALLLELALLAAELVEEDGDEAEGSDAGRLHVGNGFLLVGHWPDVVAGHQDQQQEPSHDKEANEDGDETCSSISDGLGITGEGTALLPRVINAVAPESGGDKRKEEGDDESDLSTVLSVC